MSLLDLHQNFNINNKPTTTYFQAPLMYLMARQLNARYILEVGLGSGYSSFWLGHAAKEIKEITGEGIYYGIEIHEGRTRFVNQQMDDFKIPHRIWQASTLDLNAQWIRENLRRIDLGFLDGDHTSKAIMHEVEILYPILSGGGRGFLFVHDALSASKEGIRRVLIDPYYEFEYITIPGNTGLIVLRKVGP